MAQCRCVYWNRRLTGGWLGRRNKFLTEFFDGPQTAKSGITNAPHKLFQTGHSFSLARSMFNHPIWRRKAHQVDAYRFKAHLRPQFIQVGHVFDGVQSYYRTS